MGMRANFDPMRLKFRDSIPTEHFPGIRHWFGGRSCCNDAIHRRLDFARRKRLDAICKSLEQTRMVGCVRNINRFHLEEFDVEHGIPGILDRMRQAVIPQR